MTPADLRVICDSLNDKRDTGGQTRLARMIGVDPRTIRRKLAGQSSITREDELAIQKAVEMADRQSSPPQVMRVFR